MLWRVKAKTCESKRKTEARLAKLLVISHSARSYFVLLPSYFFFFAFLSFAVKEINSDANAPRTIAETGNANDALGP